MWTLSYRSPCSILNVMHITHECLRGGVAHRRYRHLARVNAFFFLISKKGLMLKGWSS
jgi:hypothetical protein